MNLLYTQYHLILTDTIPLTYTHAFLIQSLDVYNPPKIMMLRYYVTIEFKPNIIWIWMNNLIQSKPIITLISD